MEGTEKVQELTDLQKALMLVEEEKGKRMQAFNAELQELCKKYGCSLEQGPIIIKVL